MRTILGLTAIAAAVRLMHQASDHGHTTGHHPPPHHGEQTHNGAEAAEAAVAAESAPSPKKAREVETVTMSDGRSVEFVGKTKMLKDVLVKGKPIDEVTSEELAHAHVGDVAIRIDLRNGTTRTYPLNPAIGLRYAGHGGLQKYGDQVAGGVKNEDGTESQDLDDWAYALDQLHEQLQKGEWSKTRVGGGGGGISVLIQALMEFTGRTADEVRAHIKDWSPAQRQQLMVDDEIKPIIDRIQREKAAKATHVDTGALKAGLRGLAQPASA